MLNMPDEDFDRALLYGKIIIISYAATKSKKIDIE